MTQAHNVDNGTLTIVRIHLRQAGKDGVAERITEYLCNERDRIPKRDFLAARNTVATQTDKDGLRETLSSEFRA